MLPLPDILRAHRLYRLIYPLDSFSAIKIDPLLPNRPILARHMQLLNSKLAPFINDMGSQRVIEAQQ